MRSDDIETWICIGLIWLGLMSFPPTALGCQWWAYSELKKANLKIKVMPSVVVGERTFYRNGVVMLTNTEDCRKFLHELVHAWQYQERGAAKTESEWEERETEAQKIVYVIAGD